MSATSSLAQSYVKLETIQKPYDEAFTLIAKYSIFDLYMTLGTSNFKEVYQMIKLLVTDDLVN